MSLEMLSQSARDRHIARRIIIQGGGIPTENLCKMGLLGPQCKGKPPGPDGNRVNGTLPNYSPILQSIPGPTALPS